MSEETITINLENNIVSLKISTFEGEIDPDDMLKIDYSNILGEILTFPCLMNRIGILRAEQESSTSKSKMDFEIFEAQLTEEKRKSLTTSDTDEKGKTKISKPTQSEVENAVLIDIRYRKKKEQYFQHQKHLSILDSFYWAAKDKTDKLNRLSDKLHPEDFMKEIVEGTINGIQIKMKQKLIQQKQK